MWVIIIVLVIVLIAIYLSREGLTVTPDVSNRLYGVIPSGPYIPPATRTY